MKLYAISDLHLNHRGNWQALLALPPQPDDWLVLAGDIGEKPAQLDAALELLCARFSQLIWVPGNHDLWSAPGDGAELRGVAKYNYMVELCRSHGVLTPEDPYPRWPGPGPSCRLAPIFTLYDYSFRPDTLPLDQVISWAEAASSVCADEIYLQPDPYSSRAEWCAARCHYTEQRLLQAADLPLVLINHFPLRYDLVNLPRIPRFAPWCGTRRTEAWLARLPVLAGVYGHLHIRGSYVRDGVRYEEVSLGYPRDWDQSRGIAAYLRQILPAPQAAV